MADIRVLVVDDDPLILHVLKEFFRQRRDACMTAANGSDAIRLVQDHIFDLMLTDISMPGMDGIELIRRVKVLQPQIVCILMSGLGSRRDVISGLQIGVFDFLDKPLPDLDALTMIVDRAAESGRLTRERDGLVESLQQQNSKLEFSLERLHEAFGQLRQQEEALESDLAKAQRVQRKFLPSSFPKLRGLDLSGYYAPCEQLGGDFFGVIPLGGDRFALYLVDVAGHGVSAAMITVTLRELMRARQRMDGGTELFSDPERVLAFMNRALLEEAFEPPILVTMVYAVFYATEGRVRVASAGHPAPILVTSETAAPLVAANGPVLGAMPNDVFATSEVSLGVGDVLVFYSDGLTDSTGPDNRTFSPERLQDVLAAEHGRKAGDAANALEQAVMRFMDGLPSDDDVTFIVAARTDPARVEEANPDAPRPEAVKFVAPTKIRRVRPDGKGRIRGGWRGKICIATLSGLVGWQLAPMFREIVKQAKESQAISLRVDLSECEALDSTMLGLLLQVAREVVLHQPSGRVVGQFHEMGVLDQFNISHDACPAPEAEMPLKGELRGDCSELILSAHEALMEASASNRQRFKDVVASFKQEKPAR